MRVILVGDSHMQALGPRLTDVLEPQGVEVVAVLANPGKSTKWYSEQRVVERAVEQHQPDAVVFVLGGNDQCWGEPEHRLYMDKLRQQVGGTRIVWVGPPAARRADVDTRHACSTAYGRTVARSWGVPFLNLRAIAPEAEYQADGVHFTARGYDDMALDLGRPLADALSRSNSRLGFVVGAASLLVAGGIFWAVVR